MQLERNASGREVIAAWCIEAPTDRLFVNPGPVTDALAQIRANGVELLERLAALVVLSFDPCVAFQIGPGEVEDNHA